MPYGAIFSMESITVTIPELIPCALNCSVLNRRCCQQEETCGGCTKGHWDIEQWTNDPAVVGISVCQGITYC